MRMYCLHLALAWLLAMAWQAGMLAYVWEADATGLSAFMGGLFVLGVVLAWRKAWGHVAWIESALPLLGLVGTVLGLMIAFAGVDPSKVGDIEAAAPMVASIIHGMGTALTTTLVGALGYLWLWLVRHVCE